MRLTTPAVLAERLTDGLAMALLGGFGLLVFGDRELARVVGIAIAGMVAAVVIVQIRPLALFAIGVGERMPVINRHASSLADFYESSYVLLRPRILIGAVAIGCVSWAMEGLAYYLVVLGVGGDPGLQTAAGSLFVFSVAAIVGAVMATPGGLGGTEATLVALSQSVLDLGRAPATAASLIIRLATLWFGVGIGIVCLARWPELLEGGPEPAHAPAPG
jgi:uncharacterized protein (TIRG00374 family)